MNDTSVPELTTTEIFGLMEDIEKDKRNKRGILRKLMDEQLNIGNQLLVEKCDMGHYPSYLGAVSFRWINDKVSLASEMPFLKYKYDDKGKLVVDEETLKDMRQREPDYSRELPLVRYLVGNKQRKFPPITVIVVEDWVNKPNHNNWDTDGKAKATSISVVPLDSNSRIALLNLDGYVLLYAADGQHRVIGIKALFKMIKHREITLKNKEGIERKGYSFSLTEMLSELDVEEIELDRITSETMGVEFIPAVFEGETYEEAKERVANVFVNVNKSAVQTSSAQEARSATDGFSKIARSLALDQPLFKKNKVGDRVNMDTTALPVGSTKITGLVTLVDMSKQYLCHDDRFSHWTAKFDGEILPTPSQSEVQEGIEEMTELWDEMSRLPIFEYIRRNEEIDVKREFPSAKIPTGVGHLLLRPLGQLVIATAVGDLHLDPHGPKMPLKAIFDKLSGFDKKGGFNAAQHSSIFYGVTFEPTRQRMVMGKKERQLAVDLLKYLIHGAKGEELEGLKQRFRAARTFSDPTDPGNLAKQSYLNYDGTKVKAIDDIDLPPML